MRKTLCILTVSFFVPILCMIPIACVFRIDPYQLFTDTFDPRGAPTNMRFQAQSMIRNCGFDSKISGSSTLENTSCKEAEQLLGGKFVNSFSFRRIIAGAHAHP